MIIKLIKDFSFQDIESLKSSFNSNFSILGRSDILEILKSSVDKRLEIISILNEGNAGITKLKGIDIAEVLEASTNKIELLAEFRNIGVNVDCRLVNSYDNPYELQDKCALYGLEENNPVEISGVIPVLIYLY